jgi:TonB family protein
MNAGKSCGHTAYSRVPFRFPALFISIALHGLCFLIFYSAVRFPHTAGTAPFRLFFAGPALPAGEDPKKPAAEEIVPAKKVAPVESAAIPETGHGEPADFSIRLPVTGGGGTGTLTASGQGSGTVPSFSGSDDLRELLRGLIEKKLVYPPLARKRNIEGKVSVMLKIGRDGQLLQSEISESSGSAILDKAARDLVDGIFPVRGINIAGVSIITVNVDYNLK